MNRILKHLLFFFFLVNFFNTAYCSEYFQKGVELFNNKKYEDAKFMFERSIVFDPKNSNSYLYLAKIYNHQDDKRQEEKNIRTTLLLDPKNEEAMYLLIDMELERSNFSEADELSEDFKKICVDMCEKIASIESRLKDFEIKDAS